MDQVESAINTLMRIVENNNNGTVALEIICTKLRESINSSHSRQSTDFNQMVDVLQTISKYDSPAKLRRDAKQYGLEYEEALEMAYENIISLAKGVRKGKK